MGKQPLRHRIGFDPPHPMLGELREHSLFDQGGQGMAGLIEYRSDRYHRLPIAALDPARPIEIDPELAHHPGILPSLHHADRIALGVLHHRWIRTCRFQTEGCESIAKQRVRIAADDRIHRRQLLGEPQIHTITHVGQEQDVLDALRAQDLDVAAGRGKLVKKGGTRVRARGMSGLLGDDEADHPDPHPIAFKDGIGFQIVVRAEERER